MKRKRRKFTDEFKDEAVYADLHQSNDQRSTINDQRSTILKQFTKNTILANHCKNVLFLPFTPVVHIIEYDSFQLPVNQYDFIWQEAM